MDQIKILIIEDNFITLREIEIRIKQMGYMNTETAVTGEEALEKIETFIPNLVVTDINLGKGIDGIETAKRIRQKIDVPIIYLTAYDDDDTLAKANINEPYAYLVKPLQERDLRISISIALYKHKTDKKIKELVATKDRFFNIIAHDLRSPFNAIIGFNDLMINNFDKISDEKKILFLKNIHKTSLNTLKLLENLLVWARSQSGKEDFDPVIFELNTLIFDNVEFALNSAKSKNISLDFENPSDVIMVFADLNMVNVILRNLISNAIKFTPHQGKITITIAEINNQIRVTIKDSGIGISDENIEKLFKIDQNFTQNGTDNEIGSGLGLILVHEFIEKNNGKIWVQSKIDHGSSFNFTLPKSIPSE
ncbi:MAG: response regulator [Bacteroidales bacterium]|nr:response regulator [Bacteroidales bacterium]